MEEKEEFKVGLRNLTGNRSGNTYKKDRKNGRKL
jgi:hypothetical protein